MAYISYTHDGAAAVGVIDGETIRPLVGITQIDASTDADSLASAATADRIPRHSVTLLPASPAPKRIICVGLNYRAHVAETRRGDSDYPVLFPKYASSLIASGEDIELPPESSQPDYEGELAVIIGKTGRRITEDNAWSHVLGFTPANDVTMRDFQYLTHQWMQGKAWDRSTPLGSVIVRPDEVDLSSASIRTIIDGAVVQESRLDLMLFSIPRLIKEVSTFTVLEPGDVILTGTPGGVGYRQTPQRFLKPGETVAVEIDGVGRIENLVTAETIH